MGIKIEGAVLHKLIVGLVAEFLAQYILHGKPYMKPLNL